MIPLRPIQSLSLAACRALGHQRIRHSPDAFNVIEECPACCKAWQIQGITGDETRLHGTGYERRLVAQRHTCRRLHPFSL